MTEANLMKQTVFQSSFSRLEDHIECGGKHWIVIGQNGAFLHAPFLRHAVNKILQLKLGNTNLTGSYENNITLILHYFWLYQLHLFPQGREISIALTEFANRHFFLFILKWQTPLAPTSFVTMIIMHISWFASYKSRSFQLYPFLFDYMKSNINILDI